MTEFSPEDLASAADPYAVLASVREQGAVLRSKGNWLVMTHAAAGAVLCSPHARTGFISNLYRGILPPGAAREEMSNRINFLDPPSHTRVRKLAGKAFTPRRIHALRPHVAAIARELLEPLEGESRVDLIRTFAHLVPSRVISELLGVPNEDRNRLTSLTDSVSGLLGLRTLTPAVLGSAVAAAEEMHAYLSALLDERRREPKDDLLSALLAAEDENQRLAESELLSLAATLYSAGHRTTRDLVSNGLSVLLAAHPLAESVAARRIPAAAVVEEFLRFETPTHYVARMLAEPVEVQGVRISAGEPIAVVLAAANRDPAVYDEPDRFDPLRWTQSPEPPAPLSFAIGTHYCLGANLARLEAEVMIETLFDIFPDVRLTGEPLRWWHTGLFRGLEALPVTLGDRAS